MEKNKNIVGILTFNEADNYGAMCQAYALAHFINKKYCECKIINYHNDCIWQQFHFVFNLNNIFKIKRNIELISQSKRRKNFTKFRMKLPLTERCNVSSIKQISRDFNKIIVGSDQVWNPKNTNGDLSFLLDFCDSHKKIAYAASFGNTNYFDQFGKEKDILIREFSKISVREDGAKFFLKNKFDIFSTLVMDPTLLLDKYDWEEISNFGFSKKYIFVYQLKPDKEFVKSVQMFSREQGLPVITLPYLIRCYVQNLFKKNMKIRYGIGPSEFLGFIMNAEYVLTDSFHGVALSIAMKKQFFVKLNPNKANTNERITSLLNVLNIQGRTFDSLFSFEDINYDSVGETLSKERERSREFLFSSIFATGEEK